jgi:hypothetical protein
MRAARLQELEEMAAKLLETARKLPSGRDRHNALHGKAKLRARSALPEERALFAEAQKKTVNRLTG